MGLSPELLQLISNNFISVGKYHLDPNNPSEIATDFSIDYTKGKRPVAGVDIDDFITLPPHLYSNTVEELRINRLSKKILTI